MDHRSEQHRRIGAFLRARRERINPADAGIAAQGRRRRTPGLRREEVAQFAAVSPTWYTWIEQGRELSVSPGALGRIATALQLTAAERAYLFELAEKRDPDGAAEATANEAPPTRLLATIEAIREPAYLLDAAWCACGWNPPAANLFQDWLGGSERNLLRYVFLDPGARTFIRDWPERAHRLIGEFRADTSHYAEDGTINTLVRNLTEQSPAFADLWNNDDVLQRAGGSRTFNGPAGEPLHYQQITFRPAISPAYKLVVLLPDGKQ